MFQDKYIAPSNFDCATAIFQLRILQVLLGSKKRGSPLPIANILPFDGHTQLFFSKRAKSFEALSLFAPVWFQTILRLFNALDL